MLRGIVEAVAGLHSPVLVLAVAGLAFGETAIFLDLVVPGEVGMVVAGAAGAEGDVPLVALVAGAAVGATLGDTVSFFVGRRYGTGLAHRWRWTRRRVEPALGRARDHFKARGGRAVFVGRWIGALRALVPLVAGSAGMSYRRFLPWNVAASLSWAAVVVGVGYVLGAQVASAVDRFGRLASAAVLAGALAWWLLHRRKKARAAVPSQAGP